MELEDFKGKIISNIYGDDWHDMIIVLDNGTRLCINANHQGFLEYKVE